LAYITIFVSIARNLRVKTGVCHDIQQFYIAGDPAMGLST